ncbi:hypothetical protein BH18ACT4_BH18ACT4_12520 [soil metagenome]
MGSGTAAVAALRTERHFVGFDSVGGQALRAVTHPDPDRAPVYDAVELRCSEDVSRLRAHRRGWRDRP